MKIIIIEDEKELAGSMVEYMSGNSFSFDIASDYEQALDKLNVYEYDCAIVDLMLPDGNGLDIVRFLKKEKPKCGILIVSAKNSLDDKISGLDIGADDYITKPFHLAELNSRVNSVLRRKYLGGSNEIIINEIKIDADKREITVHDKPVELTKREFDILLFFVSNQNRVVTKEAITEHVWGDDSNAYDNLDFVYTHIKNLRKKLTDLGAADYIKSIYGVGYKFNNK